MAYKDKAREKETRRAYYLGHKGQIHEYERERRKDPVIHAKLIAYARNYHQTHHEEDKTRGVAYKKAHLEERREAARVYAAAHREERRIYDRAYSVNAKQRVLEAYGGAICICCGETHIAFLAIDHINGNGNSHRREVGRNGGTNFYKWLMQNNYPPGFRVLCMNCNFAIGHGGTCPHRPTQR